MTKQDTLVYLLVDHPSVLPETGQQDTRRILLGRRLTDEEDEEQLRLFSTILLGNKREETSNALYQNLPVRWDDDHPYDMINPFGDRRSTQYYCLWTFDIREDVLYHTNRHHRSQVPLSLLRARTTSMADLERLGHNNPVPLSLEPDLDLEIPYWKPRVMIDDRLRAFLHRLLRDFHCQWRHILRRQFNFSTLQRLARAITRISTLDFEIHENTGGHRKRGAHVWMMDLPQWEPLETKVERAGSVHIILCQDIQEGLLTAKKHLVSREVAVTKNQDAEDNIEPQADYLILSVKHIMLCYATGPTSLVNTAPEPLFNGDYSSEPASELALDYLIWATTSARPFILTPIWSLPVEIQDLILNLASIGTVEAARLGCLLGLGSPYSWRDGTLENILQDRYLNRPSGSSVESLIWFGKHMSGVVYWAKITGPTPRFTIWH